MPGLTTLMIADDLTGALDSVAPFAMLGLDCVVATSVDSLPLALGLRPQVLSVNLGSREGAAEVAQARAGAVALAALRHVGPQTIWFKKIDSRMKGHVAAEVAGVIGQTGGRQVLVCPAIPDLGRVVQGGHVTGAGVAGPIAVTLDLPPGIAVDCPDAGSDADLDRMAGAAAPGTLFVGARGLAAALARGLRPGQKAGLVPMPGGPLGFCIGSRDPVTLAQVDCLLAEGRLPRIAAPDGKVPGRSIGGEVLVQATQGKGAEAAQVSAALAEGMLGHLQGLATLVVCGGETSAALLQAAGIGVLRVRGEVLAGLPLCHAVGSPGFPAIVTKSGGFGQVDTLLRLWQGAHSMEGQTCL